LFKWHGRGDLPTVHGSRSDIYSTALREYVARHDPDEVVEALDRVVAAVGEELDPFVAAAGRRVLAASDW
jgi:hypothetical protein